MPEETVATPQKPRLPGLDAAATPLIGLGLGLTGIALGFKPRLAAVPLALTAVAAILFRDPKRRTPNDTHALFAPADGTLAAIEELYEHRFLHTDAIRLVINVAPLDVPVQRSPTKGVVRYLEHVPGEGRALWERNEPERERLYIGINALWGPILLTLHAGPLTPAIECGLEEGASLVPGTRLATARFGARVDLILPADVVESLPAVGDILRAGTSRVGCVAPVR